MSTSALRKYEVMVILDPNLEERTIAPSLDAFLNVIKTDGGSVEKVDIWGKRRMAFEIKKHSEGIYAVIDLQAQPASVLELDRQLNLNESVLRTKVAAAPRRAGRSRLPRLQGWQATPSSPWSATSPPTRSCGSPRLGPPWRPSRSHRLRAALTRAATSGRTAKCCSCAARSGVRPRRTPLSRSPGACVSSPRADFQQRSYETREGEKRTVIELQVEEIGPSLRYASAKVNRTQRGSEGGFGGGSFGASGSEGGGTTGTRLLTIHGVPLRLLALQLHR